MVYKKYIQKNGKLYGPYTYHSKRVDGKVVSNYLGKKKNPFHFPLANTGVAGEEFSFKRFTPYVFVGLFIIILIVLAYFLISSNNSISGKAILELQTEYRENQSLIGNARISLKQGELIPTDTHLIVENAGNSYEYLLSDLIGGNNEIKSGIFYAEGKNLSGQGNGYGLAGEKITYPDVSFTLVINSVSSETSGNETSSGGETENNSQTPTENITETPGEENSTSQEGNNVGETPTEEIPVVDTPVEETPTETTNEQPTTEQPQIETPTEEILVVDTPVEETPTEEQPTTNSQTPVETPTETTSGNVISAVLEGVGNFFLGLTRVGTTGQVSLGIEKEIQGTASNGNPFTYNLVEGESASLKSGTVSSGGETISDSYVNLGTGNNVVTVVSSYSETESGFGNSYSGDAVETIEIDLGNLNITPQDGTLKIKLVYGGEEILSLATNLNLSNPIQDVTNETIALNETEIFNETLNDYSLTNEERTKLVETFGENFTVKTTSAEIRNNRLVLKHELGTYWIEYTYSYDSLGLTSSLNESISSDKEKWVKILADNLIEKSSVDEENKLEIPELVTESSI